MFELTGIRRNPTGRETHNYSVTETGQIAIPAGKSTLLYMDGHPGVELVDGMFCQQGGNGFFALHR
jgi:hypothetical protein